MLTLLLAIPSLAAPTDPTWNALVADPVATLLADKATPAGFRIVALSNAAESCVDLELAGELDLEAAKACTRRMAEAALDPRISPWDRPGVGEMGENNLYLTHLAIVLAARDRLSPDECDAALHARVVEHLVERSLDNPDGLARSFPSAQERWPADQAATLYALYRYDQVHGAHLVDQPLARYTAWIERARTADGLLPNEATGRAKAAEVARGSAMTWTVRYLAPVAPSTASALWTATRQALVVQLGPVTGIREWPVGHDHPADVDSGPIVRGIGASATGFGIGASRAMDDQATLDALSRTESLGNALASMDSDLGAARNSALAAAISVNQHALRSW